MLISNVDFPFLPFPYSYSYSLQRVFIGGHHMGGNSDIQELAANGQLQHRLNDVMAARPDPVRSRGELHQTL